MKKITVTIAIAATLLLGGCASSAPATQAEAPVPAASAEAPTEAPITMAPATPEAATTPPSDADAEADFIAATDYFWQGEKPSTDAWLAAGHLTCTQLASGIAFDAIVAVDGDSADAIRNNERLKLDATQAFCPEFDPRK